ncbi:MAG: hypothetical protein JKX75_09690 [Gammaproteobacteria bacterium]|nr:hypothetical protein [Gammaproteobacteria bacterium]
MLYKPAKDNSDVEIKTLDENKKAALSLAEQALKSIDIFTQDMDAELFNNKSFEQSIFALARKHPSTKVRILVQESTKAVQNGHCLIRLAQNLTSSVFIHTPSREYKNEQCAFMVMDKIGLMYRRTASNKNYKAIVNFRSPHHAGKLAEFFNEVWEQSTPDTQVRRIYV